MALSVAPELDELDSLAGPSSGTALASARRIADSIAGPVAHIVDRDARFPIEAVDALRSARLLAALVPRELGGLGHGVGEVSQMIEIIARRCASTAMIFAMHQIQVGCLVQHAADEPWFRRYLEELAFGQRLIASVTSEVGVGGDLRSSIAAIERHESRFSLEKRATTVSYGEHADDLLVTARRAPDAPKNDQVLLLLKRPELALERTSSWNTLGMRGTCSPGFVVRAVFDREYIVSTPFVDVASQSMVPLSHLFWSSVWLGIASDALARAHGFVRTQARGDPGKLPPSALRLAETSAVLDTLRGRVQSMVADYERILAADDAAGQLSSVGWSTKINALKLTASELVVDVVRRALSILGMAGYSEDGELSVARHLRDAHAAALMINNDRIFHANASLLLVQKELA